VLPRTFAHTGQARARSEQARFDALGYERRFSSAWLISLDDFFHGCISFAGNTDLELNCSSVLVLYCHLMYSYLK
jgi:hypothetical protein